MKQNISDKQLAQLNAAQRSILDQWCSGKGYDTALSIGQMIEFIQEKRPQVKSIGKDRFGKWFVAIDTLTHGHKDEICDALWESITRVLKTELQ